jgi:hypothetical protein
MFASRVAVAGLPPPAMARRAVDRRLICDPPSPPRGRGADQLDFGFFG